MAGPSRRRGVCGRGFAILKYLRYGVKSQRYPILTCPLYPHAWIRLENLNLKNGIRHPSSRPWPIGCWLKACRWRWRARTSTGFWSTNCWSHMASRSCSSTPGNFTIPGSNLESGTTCGAGQLVRGQNGVPIPSLIQIPPEDTLLVRLRQRPFFQKAVQLILVNLDILDVQSMKIRSAVAPVVSEKNPADHIPHIEDCAVDVENNHQRLLGVFLPRPVKPVRESPHPVPCFHAIPRSQPEDSASLIPEGYCKRPCCMDHPEGCLIIVFFNTGDNLGDYIDRLTRWDGTRVAGVC